MLSENICDTTINKQAAIDIAKELIIAIDGYEMYNQAINNYCAKIMQLPPAQPNNQVHLCDSCSYTYPECPSTHTDVIFGNGIGNDNICACSKYLPSVQIKSTNANEKCGYKPDCPWSYGNVCNSPNDPSYNECDYDRGIFPDGYEPKSKK